MQLMGLFKSPHNELEKGGRVPAAHVEDAVEQGKVCPACGRRTPVNALWNNESVCACGHHFRMNARQRIHFVADPGSFEERDGERKSRDLLNFPGYTKKLENAWPGLPGKGGRHLRHRRRRRTGLRPLCDGALFHDGQHGHRRGGEADAAF